MPLTWQHAAAADVGRPAIVSTPEMVSAPAAVSAVPAPSAFEPVRLQAAPAVTATLLNPVKSLPISERGRRGPRELQGIIHGRVGAHAPGKYRARIDHERCRDRAELHVSMQAEWREMDCRIEAFNDEFATPARTDEAARRLATIPSIGVLNATALAIGKHDAA